MKKICLPILAFALLSANAYGNKPPKKQKGAAPVAPTEAAAAEKQAAPAVDVEAVLDAMPGADKLNWRTSIVDLMKLVGMDASYAERKELAGEMGDND